MRLCKGHRIRAELTDEDAYGRTVAKCFLPDGRDLSEELVKQGLALDWAKFSGGTATSLWTSRAIATWRSTKMKQSCSSARLWVMTTS